MKNSKTTWFGSSVMQAAGLTEAVFNYLSGKTKSIRRSISWVEFFFVWSSDKEKFEQTKVFKELTLPFALLKKNTKSERKMEEAHTIIAATPGLRELFKKLLPVVHAVELCKEFWEFSQVFHRAKTTREKEIILEKLYELSTTRSFDKEEIIGYYRMTEHSPNYRKLVGASIGALITHDAGKVIYLAKEMPLTEQQLLLLCKKIETGEAKNVFDEDLLRLYIRTKSEHVLQVLFKKIPDRQEQVWMLGRVTEEIRRAEPDETDTLIRLLFPLLHYIVMRVGISEIRMGDVVDYLPPYDSTDDRIEEMLDLVIKYYEAYEYKLLHEYFLRFYAYVPKQKFMDLYMHSLEVYEPHRFSGSIKVFELCKDELVIDAAIRIGLPALKTCSEEFADFMDWLKAGGTPWYAQVKEEIIKESYLDKWFTDISLPSERQVEYFMRVAAHFN